MIGASTAQGVALPAHGIGRNPVIWLGLLILAIWGGLIFKMRIDWSTNAQYEFGPFVPVFIAFLLWQRWKDRPAPEPLAWKPAVAFGTAFLLLLLLPIRLIQEANPDWRPLNWVHATLVVLLTLFVIAFAGGWRWVFHFVPPLLLIFFALPWPLAMEQTAIQSMARGVTAVVTELLNLSGVPALQNGNVINVPTGPVGVEDACSGVRSLAGTLMSAIFFGEFYRLSLNRRIILLAGGVAVAFVLNLIRSFFLAWIAAKQGVGAIPQWHDQVGMIIFAAAFAVLWLGGEALSVRSEAGFAKPYPAAPMNPVRAPFLVCVALWLFTVEVVNEGWYQFRERDLPHYGTWKPVWPEGDPAFRFENVSDEARAILRYSEGRSTVFEEKGAAPWQMFYFRWEPGRSSAQLAVLHRPDICLPAAGLKFVSSGHTSTVRAGEMMIPFEGFVFDTEQGPLHVFRTLCEDRRTPGTTSGFDQSISGRLQSTWHGRRNLGQQLLQIGIQGVANHNLALVDLQARLPRFLETHP
jgi:exosortase